MNYTRIVRRIRQRMFDYPPENVEKAARVLRKAIARKVEQDPPKIPHGGHGSLVEGCNCHACQLLRLE